MSRPKMEQGLLPYPNRNRGGRRKGAGRKPKGDRAGVRHAKRREVKRWCPVMVTMRLVEGLPSLRQVDAYGVVVGALADAQKEGFRIVEYSGMSNHLHLIVEAEDREALSRGMQGLNVRLARRLNVHWNRRGRVPADRQHEPFLTSPRQVRHALRYVLFSARKHGVALPAPVDFDSSAPWFRGWRERIDCTDLPANCPVRPPRTWLLRLGWRRHGLPGITEQPPSHGHTRSA